MTRELGRFVVLAFRGQVKKQYYNHIKRISADKEGGVILPITQSDMLVFIRQAINGKVKETHIREIYDRTVREIS
jgi:phosphoribosylamine-glycine ligase